MGRARGRFEEFEKGPSFAANHADLFADPQAQAIAEPWAVAPPRPGAFVPARQQPAAYLGVLDCPPPVHQEQLQSSCPFRVLGNAFRWAFKPADGTKIIVGYEHAEDKRTSDRGIPSYRPAGSEYLIPSPASPSTFFGNPSQGFSKAKVDSVFATVEHKTDFGLTVRNHTSFAAYDKTYQNIYPGGPFALATGLVPIVAYNNINNRENLFNQTDFTYKFDAGWTRHTVLAGIELGSQKSDNFRRNGTFDAGNGDCVSFGTGNALPRGTCFAPFSNPTINSPNVSFSTPFRRKTRATADRIPGSVGGAHSAQG